MIDNERDFYDERAGAQAMGVLLILAFQAVVWFAIGLGIGYWRWG